MQNFGGKRRMAIITHCDMLNRQLLKSADPIIWLEMWAGFRPEFSSIVNQILKNASLLMKVSQVFWQEKLKKQMTAELFKNCDL